MALSNFTELKASIADWMVRSDLTSVIPDFIEIAEAEMNRGLEHWKMEEGATLSVSSRYTALPSDFLAVKRAELDDTTPRQMRQMSRAEMQRQREALSDATGKPQYYAITDNQLEVFPSPDATYSVELEYKENVPALSDSNATNWVLDDHPDLYLWGALAAGAMYEQDTERAMAWQGKFGALIEDINRQSRRNKFGGVGLSRPITAYGG